MFHKITTAIAVSVLALATANIAHAKKAAAPAPVSELVKAVDIPYQQFTLDNGLRVVVHEDRKAPVVAVSFWYGVGSKHEPEGRTGFAHLFEHLMFNGSENAPEDIFKPLSQVGSTDTNGTTWFDRTNYYETVPTGALDLALFLESDRMGHLLGAVTQEKLDIQRGVVQNEKRQGDNQPHGLVEYEQLENLYPSGHPYHHSTIGSMKDLDAASLDDVKKWFTDNYGPNNAIIVLAGDIDVATAKTKMQHWFGDIPQGPAVRPVDVPVPTLDAPKTKTIKDQVASTRIYRMWAIPGLNDPDAVPLAMAGSVLGGLASSRLDNDMVRENPIAVAVSASAQIFAQGGQFVAYADVKEGVEPAVVATRLDELIGKFLKEGPKEDELRRAVTRYVSGQIQGLESVGGGGGKAPQLAEGLLYSDNVEKYKVDLHRAAAATPEQVRLAAEKWLSRPVFSLTVAPGERTEGGENRGGFVVSPTTKGASGLQPAYYFGQAEQPKDMPIANAAADRSQYPAVGTLAGLDFPDIERGKLKNGMEVVFARRASVPAVQISVSFDVGYAADPKDALGTQSFMLSMMNEGTTSLNSTQLAETQERYGANVDSFATSDETVFALSALKTNLGASIDLLADFMRNPAFDAKELERGRALQLNRIANETKEPFSIATRVLMPELFGQQHPYGIPSSGTGDAEVVKRLGRDDLIAFHNSWLRPDNARVFVVGDTSLKQATKLLNRSIGKWKVPQTARPTKNFGAAIPQQKSRIILVDRPKSAQSVIVAGRVLPLKGSDDLLALRAGNDVLGGNFLSRINTNLRETKNWTYGAGSQITSGKEQIGFLTFAPVQADRTGDSIVEILKDTNSFLSEKGVTSEELARTVNGSVRELPGSFETSGDVMGGLRSIVKFGRPDDYYEKLPEKYNSMTAGQIDAASRAVLKTDDLLFVVVGDAETVKPQLEKTGLPIELRRETATSAADISEN